MQDLDGKTVYMEVEEIKQAIINGTMQSENLKITSNGRLICSEHKHKVDKSKKSWIQRLWIRHHEKIEYKQSSGVLQKLKYTLPESKYAGQIKDKSNRVYEIVVHARDTDDGKYCGGATEYAVLIEYNNNMTLKANGYIPYKSRKHYNYIMEPLEKGTYLEDYVRILKDNGASFNRTELINEMLK